MIEEILTHIFTFAGSFLGVAVGYLVSFSLARQNAKNDRANYISQTRFDKEFEIYQELSEKNLTAVYDAGLTVMIVRGMYDNDENKINEHLEKFCNELNDAEFQNKRYAAFIDKDIYQKYKKLEEMVSEIFHLFGFWAQKSDGQYTYKGTSYTKESAKSKIEDIQKEVSKLSDEILDNLRKYLQKLDVIT